MYLRYVLTQAWRLFFIVCEIGLYVYLWVYLQSHFNKFVDVNDGSSSSNQIRVSRSSDLYEHHSTPVSKRVATFDIENANGTSATVTRPALWQSIMFVAKRTTMKKPLTHPKEVKRVLLLTAYPICYIVLWLPGIANRLLEATGRQSSALQILQTSTTFVGFANSLSFGWNEKIRSRAMFQRKLSRSENK